MWHRFDGDLQRAVLAAFRCAGNEGSAVTTRDFLGHMAAESALVSQILARMGIQPEALLAALAGANGSEVSTAELNLTPAARVVFEEAYQIAAELGDSTIGGEHILLALARAPAGSDAGHTLAGLGVDWQGAARALMALQSRRVSPPPGVLVPGLLPRRLLRWARGCAARVGFLGYGALHPQIPFLPYALAPKWMMQNPYPFYARLRRRPVCWDSLLGQWVVTGYEDVTAALAEPRSLQSYLRRLGLGDTTKFRRTVRREFRRLQGGIGRQMLFLDAPEQPRQRSLVAKRFTPRVIAQMQDQMQEITDELLDCRRG